MQKYPHIYYICDIPSRPTLFQTLGRNVASAVAVFHTPLCARPGFGRTVARHRHRECDCGRDTRFDRVSAVRSQRLDMPYLERWATPVTIVAGSSWEADEEIYLRWLAAHPDVKIIIAPHEFDDRRIEAIRESVPGKSALITDIMREGKVDDDVRAVIVNCFGKLSALYRCGHVALIGGGFGAGIHNINEAAVYGMPVIFWPET